MKFQVLIATMKKTKEEISLLIKQNNLSCDVLVINQCGREADYDIATDKHTVRVVEVNEKGLSRSRNRALKESTADICLIADDDIWYEEALEENICKAFEEHPTYDLIAFYVERSSSYTHKELGSIHEVHKLQSLSLMSVQIAFQRNRILEKGIQFDENFGAGSGKYICGEENIFLMDCLKKGCKILYVPISIAKTDDSDSTWFQGYDEVYFRSKGAVFQRLFPKTGLCMIYVFAIIKVSMYKGEMKFRKALSYMKQGRKECKEYEGKI